MNLATVDLRVLCQRLGIWILGEPKSHALLEQNSVRAVRRRVLQIHWDRTNLAGALAVARSPKHDEVDEEGQNDEDYPEDEEGDEGEQDEKGENKDQSTPVGWADTYSNPDSDKAIRPFSPTGLSPADTRTDGWPKTQHPELPYNFQESSLISQPGQFSRVSFFRLRKQVLHQ
jgi:hypothetical protein